MGGGRVVLAGRLPAAAKLTVVLTSRCDLVTEALASLLSGNEGNASQPIDLQIQVQVSNCQGTF